MLTYSIRKDPKNPVLITVPHSGNFYPELFKKYIKNYENLNLNGNLSASIIIPDKDIIPGAKTLSPAYIVFDNYEKILQWNRSLRFALAVCTLKDEFKDEI